jgi:hypothetical protein
MSNGLYDPSDPELCYNADVTLEAFDSVLALFGGAI